MDDESGDGDLRALGEVGNHGRPQVVIIGGGFGGLNAAKALRGTEADVFLVDRENFHLFQPLLYQVATAGLQAGDIASPIRAILRRQKNVKVIKGEVHDIDRDRCEIYFEHGLLSYDYLVVATGMKTNYFGHDNWKALAPGLKTLDDALECRRRILDAFEQAEWADDDEVIEALLTFVIVGAGPTGVEMAGAIREIAHRVMVRDFRNIDSSKARVILADAAPEVLSSYHEESSAQALRDLEAMGVEVRLESMVEQITDEGVQINGKFIETQTVIWAAGVKASPLSRALDTELALGGAVKVADDLRIGGDERVYVIGDLAHFEDEDGRVLPGLAPVATQQGKHAARNIGRQIDGQSPEPFEFRDKGKMATLGRARAVAEIGKRRFSGFIAWWLWLFVHLLFLIGFRNRLFVLMDWFYAYVGMKRSSRLILDTAQTPLQRDRKGRKEHEGDRKGRKEHEGDRKGDRKGRKEREGGRKGRKEHEGDRKGREGREEREEREGDRKERKERKGDRKGREGREGRI